MRYVIILSCDCFLPFIGNTRVWCLEEYKLCCVIGENSTKKKSNLFHALFRHK